MYFPTASAEPIIVYVLCVAADPPLRNMGLIDAIWGAENCRYCTCAAYQHGGARVINGETASGGSRWATSRH